MSRFHQGVKEDFFLQNEIPQGKLGKRAGFEFQEPASCLDSFGRGIGIMAQMTLPFTFLAWKLASKRRMAEQNAVAELDLHPEAI